MQTRVQPPRRPYRLGSWSQRPGGPRGARRPSAQELREQVARGRTVRARVHVDTHRRRSEGSMFATADLAPEQLMLPSAL